MGVSFRFQGFMKYVNQRFAMAACVFMPLLMGLIVTAAHAVDAIDTGGDSEFYGLVKMQVPSGDDSDHLFSYPVSGTLLVQSEYPVFEEDSLSGSEMPQKKETPVEPITRKLPLWGEKIREMGYDLPLPFGAGANFIWMDQGIDIRELTIGTGSKTTEPNGITFNNARSRSTAATMRLDAWLLPFLNIYGLFGILQGNTELDVNVPGLTVDVPIVGEIPILDPFTIPVDVDYDGVTYGGGMTLAAGYKLIFGTLDLNYTRADINITNGEVTTLTISPRLGLLVESSAIKGSAAVWIGAMYMDYKETITDSIDFRQIDPTLPPLTLDYEVSIENDDKLNFLCGGQWEISKRWQIMAEGGLGKRKQLILGVFFRF